MIAYKKGLCYTPLQMSGAEQVNPEGGAQSGYHVLTTEDIGEITSYDPTSFHVPASARLELADLLAGREVTESYPMENQGTEGILNRLLLEGTGMRVNSSLSTDAFGIKYKVLALTQNRYLSGDELSEIIRQNLERARYNAAHPPYNVDYHKGPNGNSVTLKGRAGITRPVLIKNLAFDASGDSVPVTNRFVPLDQPKMRGGFTITSDEQFRLLQNIIKNPKVRMSRLRSSTGEKGTNYPKDLREFQKMLELADAILNRWGLYIKVELVGDGNEEQVILTNLDESHEPPKIRYEKPDLEEEQAERGPRQRNRGPSHANSKI